MSTLSPSVPLLAYLEELHARYLDLTVGEVATYIPELAKANPRWFGIAIATVDGHVYSVGEAAQPYTIQSVSNPFTYALALKDAGRRAVLTKIGVEPATDASNSIRLAPVTGAPLNPMISAGAIVACSLVTGQSGEDKFARILEEFSRYAGRRLEVDEQVYRAESMTGHRNRAIGHMLRNFEVITGDPESILTAYFRQCSTVVTTRDLAMMAATLANGGINPTTGVRVAEEEHVENVLSVMTTCGMYDYAGEWLYTVGLPAKSGVSGGILAVLPGQVGIAVFSPRLDARGNSVRGIRVFTDMARDLRLHFMQTVRAGLTPVRAAYHVGNVSSKRRRTAQESAILGEVGQAAQVFELQGDVNFAALEKIARRVMEAAGMAQILLLDLTRVARLEPGIMWMVAELFDRLLAQGKQVGVIHGQRHLDRMRELRSTNGVSPSVNRFDDLDSALEWSEEALLSANSPSDIRSPASVSLREHQVCRGLAEDDLKYLESKLKRCNYQAGELVTRCGESADSMFIVTQGQLSVTGDLAGDQPRRVAALAAGMMFGELSLLRRGVRTAEVRADVYTECYQLTYEAFDQLSESHPALRMVLLENLLVATTQTVLRLSDEVAVLAAA